MSVTKENPMGIYLRAEARCTHCGNTAPCELKLLLWGVKGINDREYETMNARVHGLETWFRNADALACSPACRDVLNTDPRYAAYRGQWDPCH
jgi:hypothetical protein